MINEDLIKEAKSYIHELSQDFNVSMFATRDLSRGEERWMLTMFVVSATKVLHDTTFLNKTELKNVFHYYSHQAVIHNLKMHDDWIDNETYSYIYGLMKTNSAISHSWLKNEPAVVDSRSRYIGVNHNNGSARRRTNNKPEESEYIINRLKTLQEVGWPDEAIIEASPLSHTRTKELLDQFKNE
jgi:hypothetical protein